ncbi:MAG: Trk system potassium transporter TrkA [Salinivirgaceae bacterium]|jgi:trk system potassium uptake protein TrkA|nr:Trk system potassium transporter TrkA [Salinivirgaceae bacterium]
MRIIIAGMGAIGMHMTKMLADGTHEIVVIDKREDMLQEVSTHYDVMTVHGSATSFADLKEAGIKRTDLFVALTHTVEINITACMIAKQLGAKKTIARIDNQEYLLPLNKSHFLNMGIDSLIYPQKLAAREIINLLNETGTTEVFNFYGDKLSLFVLKLENDAPIIGKKLSDVAINKTNLVFRAVAISREGETHIARPDELFQEGDLVYVITNQKGVSQMMAYAGTRRLAVNNVMVLGGSQMAVRTAHVMEKNSNIKIIEIDKKKSEELADYLSNTLVINADGRDLETLKEEGLGMMDVFIAVTGNDELNILSCIQAKKMGVKKTIASVENIEYLHLAESMGIDAIINKKMIAASYILRFTMKAEVPSFLCLTGSDAEVLEFIVKQDSKITKTPISELEFPKDAIIGGVIRDKSSFIATGTTHIKDQDRVVVFALPSALQKVDKFFN